MRKLINLVMYYYNCRRYGKIVAYSMYKMNGRVIKKPIGGGEDYGREICDYKDERKLC
jgi:hypothetical protein